MPRAVEQADRMRRLFVQNGHARIMEEYRNNGAFGQPRMSLHEGAADETMRDDHQVAIHTAAPAHDKVEGSCDTRVKCRPVFAVGWRKIMPERILRQFGIRRAAQVAEVALL